MVRPADVPRLIPELNCTDIQKSLAFYLGTLGFRIVYQREAEGFAMIERQGSWIMLDEIVPNSPRSWITGPLDHPFGRGINFEIATDNAAELASDVEKSGHQLYLPVEEKWYRADDVDLGVRQFIVLDPDGYMLRFSEDIGTRPSPEKDQE